MNKRQKGKARADGYTNAVMGIGARKYDPYISFNNSILGAKLTHQKLEQLYLYNGIANKIVSCPIDDALRNGFTLIDDNDAIIEDDALQSVVEDVDAESILKSIVTLNRLFGGALAVLIVNDGGELYEPLNIASLRSIDSIKVYDPSDVSINQRYSDVSKGNYKEPELFTISNEHSGSFIIHESRTIRLTGELIPRRERYSRDGWGGNIFERIRSDLMNYSVSLRNSLMILQRMSQGVLKLNGLQSILTTAEGEEIVRRRMNAIDKARSIDNTIVIDSEDLYELHNLSLGGITDVISIFQTALSASTDIPITRLFGQSPKGLNSTGESDMNNYYSMVEGIRMNQIKPVLLKLLDLIDKASDYDVTLPEKYTIRFNPLKVTNEKEKAETTKLKAEADKVGAETMLAYMQAGAMDGEEIRGNIASDYNLSGPIELDV